MNKINIDINGYWEVSVYFNIDLDLFWVIEDALKGLGCNKAGIKEISRNMQNEAKAFTFSNTKEKVSIIGLNYHINEYDFIGSVVHEAEHVKQEMLRAYEVKDAGEPPAYTVSYLVVEILKAYDEIISIRPGVIIG